MAASEASVKRSGIGSLLQPGQKQQPTKRQSDRTHKYRFLTNKPSKNEIQLWTGLIATAMIAMFIGSNQFNEALPHAVKGPEPQVQ